jgi:hypothetical protein
MDRSRRNRFRGGLANLVRPAIVVPSQPLTMDKDQARVTNQSIYRLPVSVESRNG